MNAHPLLVAIGTIGDGALSTVTSTAESAASEEISSALQTAGLTQDNIQNAVTAYTGLTADTQNAILGVINGGVSTFADLAPLIAAGLAATGVGAPVVAAVAAALPVLEAIVGALQPKPPACDWKIGATCITGIQPWGPTDPTWVPWAHFVSGITLDNATADLSTGTANANVDGAYPWYRQTIACELAAMGDAPTDPVLQFYRAYYLAWQAAHEYEVNGYQSPDDIALLTTVVQAWNAVHGATPTLTIVAMKPPDTRTGPFCLLAATGIRYINLLLDGDVTGRRSPPITINLGPARATVVHVLPLHFSPAATQKIAAESASSPSTAGKVARVAGVATILGGTAWAVATGKLASWLKF
ncbi:MAG: hypothetical protein ACREU5_12650 [Burkholderiales bacterium]